MNPDLIKAYRWLLRIVSGLLIIFSLFMFIGETYFGENPGATLSPNEILQLSIAGIGLLGLGLAWKWELIGGVVAFVAFIAIGIIEPRTLDAPLLLVFPVTAILFIALWAISGKAKLKQIH